MLCSTWEFIEKISLLCIKKARDIRGSLVNSSLPLAVPPPPSSNESRGGYIVVYRKIAQV